VYLVDDINAVFANLRGYPYLIDKGSYVIHGIVGCRIQLMDVRRSVLIKGFTGFTFITGLQIFTQVLAVDGFGKNSGNGGLSNSPWPTEQVGLGNMVVADGIFQGGGNGRLSDYRIKS
jgi:hypothetical protein